MNFLHGFRNLNFWSVVSFGSPHENEHRFFQYGSSPVVLVMSLDCAWVVGSCTWFHGWQSDFRYSSKGSMCFVKEDTFMSSYVYIQAMLLIRGIQFSTDHWNDPFLSTVCACLFFFRTKAFWKISEKFTGSKYECYDSHDGYLLLRYTKSNLSHPHWVWVWSVFALFMIFWSADALLVHCAGGVHVQMRSQTSMDRLWGRWPPK